MKKIKGFFINIRKRYQAIKQRMKDYRQRNWENTGTLVHWLSVFLFSICMGMMAGTFMRPVWLGIFLVSVLTFLLTIPVLWLLKKIVCLFLRNGITELLSWLLLCIVCMIVLTAGAFLAGIVENIVFAVLFSLLLALFLKAFWAFFYHKRHTKTIFATLIFTAIPIAAVIVLLAGKGFSDSYISAYLKLEDTQNKQKRAEKNALTEQEKVEFAKAMENGSYTVKTITYGTDGTEDLASAAINLSRFAQNDGINGFVKEKYQGYPLTETPMSGMIWYPKEVSGCPTLFIIHGNHNWITDSYLGYEYLGAYLASHGYVVVSVDENACNGLSNENDGRAVLLLENMKQVKKYNDQKDSPLYQKMDYDNLALAGHSRGGEAVATAYLFNELKYYPDNGNRSFAYHFDIQSLIAIAPTCGQYQPSDRSVELTDVNYMLLHGANDQDVTTFMGMEQYENVTFTGEKDCIKTSLYVAGANHGQFNSKWGRYDLSDPMNRMLNVENFLSEKEQQDIAKIFIRSFLDATMQTDGDSADHAEMTPIGLLKDCEKYNEFLPETLYVQSYAESDMTILCNFEEDTRLETGTGEGVALKAENADSWREELLTFSSGDSRGNYAAVLKWEREEKEDSSQSGEAGNGKDSSQSGEAAELCISPPNLDMTEKCLQFDIMDLNEEFTEESPELLEAEVLVTDSSGKEALVNIGDYARIYPAFPVRLNKLQYVFHTAEYKHQFQTVSIPAEDFQGVDVREITNIILRFPKEKGNVAIDNVGIVGF